MQDSLTDFFANWLPEKVNNDGYVESLLTRRDYNINEFIKSNITFDQQNIEGNVLGIWKPFVDYMNSELKDMPFEIDEIISDEDSGSENYKMRDDIKRGDNDRSQKEYLKGQVKFILSLLQKVEGSLSFKQRMNALTNRINTLVGNCNGPEVFYKRVLKHRNDEYLSQIIDIIGYPPISQEDFENLPENVQQELKDKNVVYDKNASVKHSQADNDRVFSWNLFAISFNQSNQVAVLSSINIKEEYTDNPTVFNSWAEENYDDNPNYSYEEGDAMPDGSESEQQQVKKSYVFNFSIKTEDQQDKEVVDYINNSLVNSDPSQNKYEDLGLIFTIEKNGLSSNLKVQISQRNKFNEIKGKYILLLDKLKQYNDVDACINFFKSIGINIKVNEVAKDIFTKYGSNIIANIISNIMDNPSFNGKYAVDIATITNLRKIITGINFARFSKVIKSQIDIYSSFAAYNGEKNLSNRNAMNSYLTQISKIINDEEFQEIMNSSEYNSDKKELLVEKFPYLKSFIESPYFDVAFKEGTYLYKLTHQESAVIRNNGLSILRNDTFKNGSVPFGMEENLKIISNIYNGLTANIYTPLQWADKEPALALLAIDDNGYFSEPISDFSNSNVLNVLMPFINAEIQRIKQVRRYADNPSLYFNGDRNYLKSGQNVSFIDKIIGSEDLVEQLISFDGTVDNYINEKNDVRKTIETNIGNYFAEQAKEYFDRLDDESKEIVLKVGGANISSANRSKVNGNSIKSMVYAFIVSDFIVGINQSILLTGDMNNYDNFSKRIGPVISTGELHENDGFLKIALDETNIVEGKNNSYAEQQGILTFNDEYLSTRDYDRVVVTDDPITTSKFKQSMYKYELVDENSYKDMETANAIGYITFDSYKRRLQKNSKWTKEQDRLYYKIINGEEVSLQDVKKHFQPLKYQYAAPIRNSSVDQRALLKNMYFPLIPTAIEDTGLQELHNMMVKENIDMITVKNGSKLNDKTDHQGQHTSLFRFGIIDGKFNDKVLCDSIRYVNIYLSTNGTDVVKGNGHSAIEKLKIDGKIYDDTEVIYTDTKLEDNPEQTIVLKVVRTDGKVTGLVRCKIDGNNLVELEGNNTCTLSDKNTFMFDGNAVSISDNSFEVESKFMRDQLVIHNEEGETIAIQTQLMSEATMNIFDAGQVLGSTEKEKEMNKDAVDSFEGSFKALYNYHLNRVMSKICVLDDNGNIRKQKDKEGKDHYVIDQDKVLAMIKKEANMSTDIPQVVYEGLTRENVMDKLNNSTYSSVLMKLLLGRISKDITKIKVFGDNLKQAPDLLTEQYYNTETLDGFIDSILKSNSFDEVKVSVDGVTLNKPTTKNNNGMVFESDGSNFYSLPEDAAEYQRLNPAKAQVTFSKDFFFLKDHPVVVNYCIDNNIGLNKLENATQLCKIVNECIAEGLFKDEPNLFKLVGVRIPTQGYNFMDFMEIGRFIDPALGPMIILPKEMVEKNGSDYDVDSMPIMFPHITSYASLDDDGNIIRNVEFTTSDTANKLNDSLSNVNKEIEKLNKAVWLVETLSNKQLEYNVLNLTKDEYNKLTNNGKNFVLLRNQISIINKSLNRTKKNLGITDGCKDTLKTELLLLFNSSNYNDYSKSVNTIMQTINNDVSDDLDISKLRQLTSLRKELARQIKKIEQHYLENNLMLSIYNLLSLPINRKSLLKKSDTHLFTENKVGMYSEYLSKDGEQQSPKKFGSILNDTLDEKDLSSMDKIGSVYNEFVRNSNNVSMTALGIAAVAAKWSVIWSRIGATMKNEFTYGKTNYQTRLLLDHNIIDGLISLGNVSMQDKLSKSEVHDELISGFVDGAKDPWPSSLGFNIQTIPVVEFMVWAGCKRDDIISLVNYKSIKNYVSKWQSFNKGLTRYIGDVTGYEDRTGKSVFFKNSNGIISETLRSAYEDLYNASQKDSRPSFESFAYAILQNVTSINSKDLAANNIISNGKKSSFEENYKPLFENVNSNVQLSSKEININGKAVSLIFDEISYSDFAVLQYLMLEKMSNDITNFTTKMEADKNVYKTVAELEEYKELKTKEANNESTFDYTHWIGELKQTNMGVRFYNDEISSLIKDIMLTNQNTESSSWRFNEKLNKLIYDIISKTVNGEKLSDNMDYAKDKIFEYFYQNEFARRNIYNNRVSVNPTEKEFAQKHGGYFVEYVNGIKTYVYDYTMMFEMYQTNKGIFSCFPEFLNFVFKRDNLHTTLQKQAMEIISKPKTETDINNDEVEYYNELNTKLSGDILYDSIMTIMFNKSRVNNKVYKKNIDILLSSVFETYCYVRSCIEICNYQALFNTKAFGDESLTYADLVNNILNGNSVLLETFPMLANLFVVSNWKGNNYLKLTAQLNNNTSNDQYGDETKQVMDVLTSNHGITNIGILINALTEQELRSKEVDELDSNDNIRINNKAKSISWIFSIFQNYCLLQSGNGISGKYGLAKFGDDEYRATITRNAVTKFVDRIDNNDKDAIEQLNYILRFKTGDIPGIPKQTEEKFVLRDFSGENYVDEAYMSSVSNTSNPIVVQMTGQKINKWKAKQYSLISPKKNSVYFLDEENKVYSSMTDYDVFVPMIASYLLQDPEQQIFDTVKVVDTSKNEEYVYIYLFGNYVKLAYTQTQGEGISSFSYYESYSDKTSETDKKQIENLVSKIGILNVDVTKFEIKNYLKDNLVQKYNDQLKDKKQYVKTNFSNLFSPVSIEEYIDAYLNSNVREKYLEDLRNSVKNYIAFNIDNANELNDILTNESSNEKITTAIIDFRNKNNYQKFGLTDKSLDVNNLTQLDYPIDVLNKYLEKFTTDEKSNKELSDDANMAISILNEKAGTYELYKRDNNSVGGNIKNGERFTLSVSGGNSIDIVKDTNTKGKVVFKFDSQGPKGNASRKTFSTTSQNLISTLISGNINNIKYETVSDKELIAKLSEQIKKVDSKQNAILINGDDIFVKFANTFYKVTENKMEEKNNIKPFINNIYYIDSEDVYSGDFKLGGFKIAESVEQLLFYVGSTNDDILITSNVKDQIMNDENKLFYLSNILKLDLTETGFAYDKSDKSVIETNNCK